MLKRKKHPLISLQPEALVFRMEKLMLCTQLHRSRLPNQLKTRQKLRE
uniref:Uncharacterized protein n=1 Tax=Arundo donax TaxID=35708 RepID=A0A0A9DHH6_ARUDO